MMISLTWPNPVKSAIQILEQRFSSIDDNLSLQSLHDIQSMVEAKSNALAQPCTNINSKENFYDINDTRLHLW